MSSKARNQAFNKDGKKKNGQRTQRVVMTKLAPTPAVMLTLLVGT